jgi:putative transposase
MDQLWVADITYIRLKAEFVYLAVILDAFSRKVVGWALDPGLVHHSDRGLQYARSEYVALLEKYGMVPSMSRPANPQPGTPASEHRRVHRGVLQSTAIALGAGLPISRGI